MTSPLSDEVASLLEGRRIGVLGTINADESVHLVSVWFLFDGERLLVPTSHESRKARNVRRHGRATLMVDTRAPQSMRGVSLSGPASVITGDRAESLNHRIHARYLSKAALEDPRVGPVFREGDDVTVRLDPTSIAYWDMVAEPLLPMFEEPGYMLPLRED